MTRASFARLLSRASDCALLYTTRIMVASIPITNNHREFYHGKPGSLATFHVVIVA